MFRLWNELESSSSLGTAALRQLPQLLTRGASSLEIARHTHLDLSKAKDVLSKLEEFGIVEGQSTGTSFPETMRVYHLTSDGVLFFREVAGRSTSDW
jgi:hypothetical protein